MSNLHITPRDTNPVLLADQRYTIREINHPDIERIIRRNNAIDRFARDLGIKAGNIQRERDAARGAPK